MSLHYLVKLNVLIIAHVLPLHRRNNRRDRGRLVSQLLGWGTNNVLVPNFLAVVFKKQEISQQVVTRKHDLAFEFSQIFRGWYPQTLTAGERDPSRSQHPARTLAGREAQAPWCWDPNLGPPQLFSHGYAPVPSSIRERNSRIYSTSTVASKFARFGSSW